MNNPYSIQLFAFWSVIENTVSDDGHDDRQGQRFGGGRNNTQITGVRLKNAATGEEKEIACDGVFVSVANAAEEYLVNWVKNN